MADIAKKRAKEKPKPAPKPMFSNKNRSVPDSSPDSVDNSQDDSLTEVDAFNIPDPASVLANDIEVTDVNKAAESRNPPIVDVNGNTSADTNSEVDSQQDVMEKDDSDTDQVEGNVGSRSHGDGLEGIQTRRQISGVKPTPKPRVSLMKSSSFTVEGVTMVTSPQCAGFHDDLDRSISSSSQDSGRSMTRSSSYGAALDLETFDEVSDKCTSQDDRVTGTKGEASKQYTQVSMVSGTKPESHVEIHSSPKDCVNVPKRKAPPPPRPAVNPVGVLPTTRASGQVPTREGSPVLTGQVLPRARPSGQVPTREGSPLRTGQVLPTTRPSDQVPTREGSPLRMGQTSSREGSPFSQNRVKEVRSASPPCTRPKPARRLIDQALTHQSGGEQRTLSSSVSTPNISKHQRQNNSEDLKKAEHHQSSGDVKNKPGSVSQMVQALSRLNSGSSGKKSPDPSSRRMSGSQFYYDLDGSQSQDRNSSGGSSKKDKHKIGSVFYRDVAVSAGGTLKFEGIKDSDIITSGKKSKKSGKKKHGERRSSESSYGKQELHVQELHVTLKQESLLDNEATTIKTGTLSAEDVRSTDDSGSEKPEVRETTTSPQQAPDIQPVVRWPKVEDCKSSDKDVLSSDGNSSPVAPPRTKRRSKLFKQDTSELSLTDPVKSAELEIETSGGQQDVHVEQESAVISSVNQQEISDKPPSGVASDEKVTSELEDVPSDPRPDPEGHSGDSCQIYENHDAIRREHSDCTDTTSRPPTIIIRSTSDDMQIDADKEAQNAPGMNSPSLPTDEDMDDVYLSMSLSMPGGFGNPAHHRYSDISMASTISDDYTPMTGENLQKLLLGHPEYRPKEKRSSSWSGPDTDEALESALASLRAPDESLHNMSRSTEDSDSSTEEEEDTSHKLMIVQSLQEIKAKLEKKTKKIFCVAQEMMTSEESFVNVLKLINEDFREAVKAARGPLGGPVIPYREIDQILKLLPLLQNFSEDLLKDLKARVDNWDKYPKIADVFVKKGPFLKMYTTYIREFEPMCASLEESRKRYSEFDRATNEFEAGPLCSNLAIKHFMLKPIQRIPQYRLMLLEYQKNLTEVSQDYEDTQVALKIVSEVAEHANSSMAFGDNLKKLIEIQNELIGPFEVIKPGRLLVKSGELQKMSRKEQQRRMFFLFTDTLLCTTFVSTGYKYNSELPLAAMKVTKPDKEDFRNEFSIISTTRSFNISASTPEERDEWLKVLQDTVREYNKKRYTYMLKGSSTTTEPALPTPTEESFKLGQQAPVWIPDARVSMCVKCHEEFTMTFRRHHCRACGKVFCWMCCDNRAPLRYQSYKVGRVCIDCYDTLLHENTRWQDSLRRSGHTKEERLAVIQLGRAFIRGSARSQGTIWGSFGKGKRKRPSVLNEVKAMEENTDMSGYMGVWESRRWKKVWFVLKEKVLYFYKASEDTAAMKSMALVGFEVRMLTEPYQKTDPDMLFELTHRNVPPMVFKVKEKLTRDKWVKAMQKASAP